MSRRRTGAEMFPPGTAYRQVFQTTARKMTLATGLRVEMQAAPITFY
ncbi:hypothetical protein BSY16_5901 (plasmid) [Sinorhizobium sp. RAC02]|nr:hypothetical protein BSY16_5901 [Sinorhizobium sp. RAC02]